MSFCVDARARGFERIQTKEGLLVEKHCWILEGLAWPGYSEAGQRWSSLLLQLQWKKSVGCFDNHGETMCFRTEVESCDCLCGI